MDVTDRELAILAHRLWASWTMTIAQQEDISEERIERWEEYWVPFDQLEDEVQQQDHEVVERYLDQEPDYPPRG